MRVVAAVSKPTSLPMNLSTFQARLEECKASDSFSLDIKDDLARLAASDVDPRESMRVILEFMEENPETDFGSPGSLVHYLEGLLGQGYEEALLSSVGRKPICHTVWMVNRLANGKDAHWKKQALETLVSLAGDESAASEVRELAEEFCESQRNRASQQAVP